MNNQMSLNFGLTSEEEQIVYKSLFNFNARPVEKFNGSTGSTVLPVWNTYDSIKFDGSLQVENHSDVANIMRSLENKSIELAFAVHVNDKDEALIQFLSMGGRAGTVIDSTVVLSGVNAFDSKHVYLVHNHPSGNLKPSPQDIELTKKIKKGLSYFDVGVSHVILNTYRNEYTYIEGDFVDTHFRHEKNNNTSLNAYVFDEMKVLSEPIFGSITSSQDVAELIQQKRFSAFPKYGVLALATNNSVIANFLVDDLSIKNVTDVIAPLPNVSGVIAYGNTKAENEINLLNKSLKENGFRFLDYIQLNSNGNGVSGAYKSSADDGLISEIQGKYGTSSLQNELKKGLPWESDLNNNISFSLER